MSAQLTAKRALVAAALIVPFLLSVFVVPLRPLFPLLVAIFGALCLYELGRLIALRTRRFPFVLCYMFVFGLVADGYFRGLADGLYILTAFVVVALSWRVLVSDSGEISPQIGAAFLATAYIGLPMAMAAALWQAGGSESPWLGPCHLVFQLGVLFGGDTAAYFIGRNWGRRPFFPRISPKKTLEGAVASLAVSVVIAAAFTLLIGPLRDAYGLRHGLILGLLLGVATPLGDLAESTFKRDVGRKDSGNGLHGHGGFLDVFDSLLFGIPLQFCYVQLVLANPCTG